MAPHVVGAVAAGDDHAIELAGRDRIGFGIDGDRVAVLALVGLGAAGAHHEDVGARFAQAVVRVPQLEVFVERLGQDGNAHSAQFASLTVATVLRRLVVLIGGHVSHSGPWRLPSFIVPPVLRNSSATPHSTSATASTDGTCSSASCRTLSGVSEPMTPMLSVPMPLVS